MEGNGGGRKFPMVPFVERKNEKDEDLVLFRELNKRENDRFASLLQPFSDEFEPNPGNYSLYRIGPGKKGSGYEFFGENNKNDYDWLKTPPATPLFPSLEMEATKTPELVVQREIPILQPLSRFAGNSATTNKGTSGRPKSPKQKQKQKIPVRSITPSHTSTETKNTKITTFPNYKTATATPTSPTAHLIPNNKKPNNEKQSHGHHIDFITSNLAKNMELTADSKTKPRSRGVSPSMRSTIPAQIPGFSNEPPPNLRTDRSTSATRGRPVINPSPSRPKSVTRSRKVDDQLVKQKESDQKGRFQTQILGSRMVEKVMNARKSGAEERETKANNLRGSNNNSEVTPGFIAKNMMPKSSLDMAALMHNVEIKRDGSNARQLGTVRRKR